MGIAKYKRLQLELSTRPCGCRRDKSVICDQHLQVLPVRERLAYLSRRRQQTQHGQATP